MDILIIKNTENNIICKTQELDVLLSLDGVPSKVSL